MKNAFIGCILLRCSSIDQLIWATVNLRLYPRGYQWASLPINGWLFTFMNQVVLDFLQCSLITKFFTIISHSLSEKEAYTDSIFNHSYTILPPLKEMEFAITGKDISKETGLTTTVTTKTAFLWCSLLKALFLWWHKVRPTSSHIVKTGKLLAHMATAVCQEHYQAQDAAWLKCSLPIAFRALHVFHGCSPDP